MSAVREAIDKANAGFCQAVGRGDVPAAAQVYTEDAKILPPGHPMVTGRKAIEEFWAGAAQQMGMTGVELKTVELTEAGDTAYEIGRFKILGAKGPLGEGKFVVVWKRGAGGWRWHIDIWNPDA